MPAEPGKYTGEFDVEEKGVYLIKAVQEKNGEILKAVNSGAALQYSPEYKIRPKSNNMDLLVNETGAQYINSPEQVYLGEIEDIKGRTDITNILLILALVLFVLDIALRRLNIPYNKNNKIYLHLLKYYTIQIIKILLYFKNSENIFN